MQNIKVLTFNIRRDKGDDGINNWDYRKPHVAALLKKYRPDVAVFQEVLAHQLEDLKKMLSDYHWTGVGRDDGKAAGEFAPIFYKDLTVKQQGTFWFSDTPDIPSCTWPGMTRICTWVDFNGKKPFTLLNTHLEYQFEETQLKSIDLIRRRITEYSADHPFILTGDFNFNPDSRPYEMLSYFFSDSFTKDSSSAEESSAGAPAGTYHGFTGKVPTDPQESNRIDYIWYRGKVETADFRIIMDRAGEDPGVYPSDHWPVICRCRIT